MKILSIMFIFMVLLYSCSKQDSDQDAISVTDFPQDEKLIAVSKKIPEFGGMYIENGTLYVYMLDANKRFTAEQVEARINKIQSTITRVYGENVLKQKTQDRKTSDVDRITDQALNIKIVQGKYTILQLSEWRQVLKAVHSIPGVVFTDLDEKSNRLRIGLEPHTARSSINKILKNKNVPLNAVFIEETTPVMQYKSLRDKFRSMPGAIQVESDTGIWSYKICTMGFNAIRGGVSGFVTNSHCTTTQGGNESTVFHQPNDPWWTEGNKVGKEIADPGYFTGGACPAGRKCRYSDSAFIDYSIAKGSNIARSQIWNTGTLTVRADRPRLFITGEMSAWVNGSELDKIGRTTGWTYGVVNNTCADVNVSGTTITLLCQYYVNRRATHSHSMVDSGDSGSPVFRWLGDNVTLSGILWGGPVSGDKNYFVFSPMNQIEAELGMLTTYDFPQPNPPGGGVQCPTGQKCCETDIINGQPKCILCVPNNASCP